MLSEKNWIISVCNCKSEINNVCKAVEGHCLPATKIVHYHSDGWFDWLISEHQCVNPSREVISILSGQYKRFTFVHWNLTCDNIASEYPETQRQNNLS